MSIKWYLVAYWSETMRKSFSTISTMITTLFNLIDCLLLSINPFMFLFQHSASIVSTTVQVFTVPTIARRLIAEENALHIILNSLIKFCENNYLIPSHSNDQIFILNFTNNTYPAILRRALYMLHDAAYLLTLIPNSADWTQTLCLNFESGAASFIHLLFIIQVLCIIVISVDKTYITALGYG